MSLLQIISAKNAAWADTNHQAIDCEVMLSTLTLSTVSENPAITERGPVPFKAMATDPELHGRKLWADLIAGKYGPIAAYAEPPAPPALATDPTTPRSAGTQKL